jgi:hypothetical protein
MIVHNITFLDEETGKVYTTHEGFDHSVIAESVDMEDLVEVEQ